MGQKAPSGDEAENSIRKERNYRGNNILKFYHGELGNHRGHGGDAEDTGLVFFKRSERNGPAAGAEKIKPACKYPRNPDNLTVEKNPLTYRDIYTPVWIYNKLPGGNSRIAFAISSPGNAGHP